MDEAPVALSDQTGETGAPGETRDSYLLGTIM